MLTSRCVYIICCAYSCGIAGLYALLQLHVLLLQLHSRVVAASCDIAASFMCYLLQLRALLQASCDITASCVIAVLFVLLQLLHTIQYSRIAPTPPHSHTAACGGDVLAIQYFLNYSATFLCTRVVPPRSPGLFLNLLGPLPTEATFLMIVHNLACLVHCLPIYLWDLTCPHIGLVCCSPIGLRLVCKF